MTYRNWNWKHKNWPQFTFDVDTLKALEMEFLKNTGTVVGILKHVKDDEKEDFLVEVLSNEAMNTSEIEGEYLNRDSVQSSIKQNLGLANEKRKVPPAEYGISEMMVDLYLNFDKPLNHEQLFEWHKMITNGRRDLLDIGKYRTHKEPMQVVSGRMDKPTVHFEAPPSEKMPKEMEQFINWFQLHHFDEKETLMPLTKAGIAHLYFVCIHPFEDGNGRVGRAIAEKSLAISTGRPVLMSLSQTIQDAKKHYYDALENNNKDLNITEWLVYFGKTIIQSQENTMRQLDFLINKTKFYDTHKMELNERQLKVVQRLFQTGYSGFIGGLSAENYVRIAKTSASTATRDLKDLVDKKVLLKTGTLKSTRYFLNIKQNKN
jgi:Fic family protein